MQSSTAVMLRALVMLACVVAIPMAALCGKSLPQMLDALLDGCRSQTTASACVAANEMPHFEPYNATVEPEPHPFPSPGSPGLQPSLQTGGGRHQPPTDQPPTEAATSGVIPAGYRPPANSASVAVSGGPDASQQLQPPFAPAPVAVPRFGSAAAAPPSPHEERPNGQSLSPTAGPAAPARPTPGSPQTADGFAYVQDRLRQLGATAYSLEFWGSRQQLYRFSCKMAVGQNPGCVRYFEATDTDHLKAMTEVLREVEAWQTGLR
ncbi:MAG: hypothetical protein JXB62_05030 [Pirellulales bacterium]|nr:hypothetical protein [Pirellulales bacterium]